MNLRMLAPTRVAHQVRTVNGRTYSATTGTMLSVPEHDGRMLESNGWSVICLSGPTAQRPKGELGPFSAKRGTLFWDETLNKMIVTDGQNWRDIATGAVN